MHAQHKLVSAHPLTPASIEMLSTYWILIEINIETEIVPSNYSQLAFDVAHHIKGVQKQ